MFAIVTKTFGDEIDPRETDDITIRAMTKYNRPVHKIPVTQDISHNGIDRLMRERKAVDL